MAPDRAWGDICAAATGLLLWGCHAYAWAMPVISAAALFLSLAASGLALWRMLRDPKR
jgi:hypothetical protein